MPDTNPTNPITQLHQVEYLGNHYQSIALWCPGCASVRHSGHGLHLLPVSGDVPPGVPRWDFDGNLDAPTLTPSILTRIRRADGEFVCHSFLRNGVWEYLSDSTHAYSGQSVPAVPLPDYAVRS